MVFLLEVLCISCTKELQYELVSDEKLVLSSIFNSEQKVKIYIGNTTSFFHTDTLSNTQKKYRLRISMLNSDQINSQNILDTLIGEGLFNSDVILSVTQPYLFELNSPKGDTISVTEITPIKNFIEDASLVFPVGIDNDNTEFGELSIKFQDNPDVKNYYEIVTGYYQDNTFQYLTSHLTADIPQTDAIILNEGLQDYNPTSCFFSDELFNGKIQTIRINGYFAVGFHSGREEYYFFTQPYVILRSVSESYYLYLKYLTKHLYNQQFQGDFWQTIYMSEPQNMYSNVDGGFGVVVSYSSHKKEIELVQ